MTKRYCYQVKFNYLKLEKRTAYAHAKIEDFGFAPIFEEFEEGNKEWTEGWAKNILVSYDSVIGRWIRNNIENIYKTEKEKEDSKWAKEIVDAGYEFDNEGKLILNEKAKEDIQVQLCVMASGTLHGLLFINVGGAMELYDSETLLSSVPDEIQKLLDAEVIYKKRFYEK